MSGIIGIDPGQSGGIVLLTNSGEVVARVKMPETETDILHYLELWKPEQPTVFLEIVHSLPGNKAQSMFKFGTNYGAIRMAVLSCRYRLEGVRPQSSRAELPYISLQLRYLRQPSCGRRRLLPEKSCVFR